MKKIQVMVNGLPGKMATKVAEHLSLDPRFSLILFSQKGSDIEQNIVKFAGKEVLLLWPTGMAGEINKIKKLLSDFIVVDYTHPTAVNSNAEFYCKNKLPFVMGTTGGDRKILQKTVDYSRIPAVIAPNMAKQIVVFQEMMRHASKAFPDVFKGYKLEIVESHQKGKADTSGTAKAMIEYFNELGIPFSKDQIKMIREPEDQKKMGVPGAFLDGHGWHTYTLRSADDTVLFRFTHNVNGRDVYAKGTLDAIVYLDQKIKQGFFGRVFTMMDVAGNI
jgi:4-hydroxy-tetrahydrodipicolinate reductase